MQAAGQGEYQQTLVSAIANSLKKWHRESAPYGPAKSGNAT